MSTTTAPCEAEMEIPNNASIVLPEQSELKPESGLLSSITSTFLVLVAAVVAVRVLFAGLVLGIWNTRYIDEASPLGGAGSSLMSYTSGFVATIFPNSASAIEVVIPTFWPLLFALGFGVAASNPFLFTGRKSGSSTAFIVATSVVLYLVQALFLTLRHWSELGIV